MFLNKLAELFYPSYFVWHMPSNDKDIYLSFDDGPVDNITEYVLEILDIFKIKASFFCVGDNVIKNQKIFNSIISKEHIVGNHTYNHLNGWKTEKNIYIDNVEECHKIVDSALFRPPYGRISHAQANLLKHKYKIIMWSVLTYDFNNKLNHELCLNNCIRNTKKGDIIVFHDNLKAEKNLKYVLPRFIEHFLEKGYSFKTL